MVTNDEISLPFFYLVLSFIFYDCNGTYCYMAQK